MVGSVGSGGAGGGVWRWGLFGFVGDGAGGFVVGDCDALVAAVELKAEDVAPGDGDDQNAIRAQGVRRVPRRLGTVSPHVEPYARHVGP